MTLRVLASVLVCSSNDLFNGHLHQVLMSEIADGSWSLLGIALSDRWRNVSLLLAFRAEGVAIAWVSLKEVTCRVSCGLGHTVLAVVAENVFLHI